MTLKIRFKDFWPGFNPVDNLFVHVLRDMGYTDLKVVENPKVFVDLEFDSVYGKHQLFRKLRDRVYLSMNLIDLDRYQNKYLYAAHNQDESRAKRTLWYTAENIPPIFGNYSGTISFQASDSKTNNLYFPYWMYRLDWGYKTSEFFEIRPKPKDLCKERKLDLSDRRKYGVVFTSHRSPIRESFITKIERVMRVDKFGSAYGKRELSKTRIAQNYIFQLCPENSFYPGYVTEKIVEAWTSGNLAIWQGIMLDEKFNRRSYLDLTLSSNEELHGIFSNLTLGEVIDRICQPLLLVEPTLNDLKSFLSRTLETK